MQRLEHSDVVEHVLLFTRNDTFTTVAECAVRTLFPGLDIPVTVASSEPGSSNRRTLNRSSSLGCRLAVASN